MKVLVVVLKQIITCCSMCDAIERNSYSVILIRSEIVT